MPSTVQALTIDAAWLCSMLFDGATCELSEDWRSERKKYQQQLALQAQQNVLQAQQQVTAHIHTADLYIVLEHSEIV